MASRSSGRGVDSWPMVPPRFEGPTHQRPRCCRVVGDLPGLRVERLKLICRAPCGVESCVNWCGHSQKVIPFPRIDGLVELLPVPGETT